MNLISPLIGKLNAPDIITALRGNGRTIKTAAVRLRLLRDAVTGLRDTAPTFGHQANIKSILSGIASYLKSTEAEMLAGKPKLARRVKRAYDLSRKL